MPEPDRRAPSSRPASRDRPAAAARRAAAAQPRGRSWSAVLLALLGFARSPRCASTTSTTPTPGCREQDLIDVLNGLAGTTAARRGRDRPARAAPATTCSPSTERRARPRSSRPQRRPTTLEHPGRAGAGHRARASGSRSPRPTGQVDARHAARHGRGAAHRRRRGDGDQRRGAGRRPDLVRGRRAAASWSTASCSSRRTSST